MPRLLAIGDIHGCLTALETLVEFVQLSDDDLLITLGDYVDRGPNTREVLDWLIKRHKRGHLIPLFGNHEIMMLQARDDDMALRTWLEVGGAEVLVSYGLRRGDQLDDVPEAHWQFMEYETRPYYETDTHFFVHANALSNRPLAEQPDEILFWKRFDYPPPHQNGKIMVCGHTAQRSGLPLDIGHAVCIDTRVYDRGWLTCLEPKTGNYWQANQSGETRQGCLESRR